MPFNGSGSFQPLPAPDFPAVAGTTIVADYYNNVLQDVFDGLTNCLTRDGQSAPLANLPMGGFKFTGAAAASAVGQFLTWGQSAASLGDLTVTNDLTVDTTTLKVDATTNRVGIGTATPLTQLDIANSGVNVGLALRTSPGSFAVTQYAGNGNGLGTQSFDVGQDASSQGFLYARGAHPIMLGTSNLERVRILANGRVGIGTSTPARILDVNDAVAIRGPVYSYPANAGTAEALHVVDNGGYLGFFNAADNTRTGYLQFNAGGDIVLAVENATRFLVVGNFQANNVLSGSYVPTLTPTANCSIVGGPYTFYYSRIGNLVTVFGYFGMSTSGVGSTRLEISLPIASTFISAGDLAGSCQGGTDLLSRGVDGVVGSNVAECLWYQNTAGSGGPAQKVHFSYRII